MKKEYSKPVMVKQKTMRLAEETIKAATNQVICKQCSSCHGCR